MLYSYRYPRRVRVINGRSGGRVSLPESFLYHTHEELMAAFEDPRRTISAQATIEASPERVWRLIGSAESFFALQPRFAGLTPISGTNLSEGSRYIIHRAHDGLIFDRVGEVLVRIRERQLTVSDLDIADASVSGHFPSMFTLLLEPSSETERVDVRISFTTVGVLPALIPAVLLLQLRNLQELAEPTF